MNKMKFCKKCGNILKHIKEDEKVVLKCNNCEYSEDAESHLMTKEKMRRSGKKTGLPEGKNLSATFPHKCKMSGYDQAEVMYIGIGVSDEDPVIMSELKTIYFSVR